MELTCACQADLPLLRQMWAECFGEAEDYLDFYYRNRFVPEDTLLVRENGRPVAMLTLMNVTMGGKRGFYIYAVATLPEFRGRGLQRQLSSYAEKVMAERGGEFCCLVPAEESLFRFYEKLGYERKFSRWEKWIGPYLDFDPVEFYPCSFKMFAEMRAEYLNTIPNALVHPDRELGYIYQELCCCGGYILRFYEGEKPCYAAYTAGTDAVYLREQTGSDPDRIARALMELHQIPRALVTSAAPFSGASRQDWGMGKSLRRDAEFMDGTGYMALMLD